MQTNTLRIYIAIWFFLLFSVSNLFAVSNLLAQELPPPSISRIYERALYLLHQGQYDSATVLFDRISKQNKAFLSARLYMSDALYFSGLWDAALAQAEVAPNLRGQQRARLIRHKLSNFQLAKKINADNQFVLFDTSELSIPQSTSGQPVALSIAKNGNLWVTDIKERVVREMNTDGSIVKEIYGPWYARLAKPIAMAIDSKNQNIYVCDFSKDEVRVFDITKKNKGSFGGKGTEAGKFLGPRDVIIDERNFVYVLDFGNHRIQKFTSDGRYLFSFGNNILQQPTKMVFDRKKSRIYVADPGSGKIQVFTQHGKHILEYGEGILEKPVALAIYESTLLVADHEQGILLMDIDNNSALNQKKYWHRLLVSRGKETVNGTSSARLRVKDIVVNKQGNIIVLLERDNRMAVLIEVANRYVNLEARVLNIDSVAHPKILVEVTAQDRKGKFISSLSHRAFQIYENEGRIYQFAFANLNSQYQSLRLALVREDSLYFKDHYRKQLLQAVDREILQKLHKHDSVSVIFARHPDYTPWRSYSGQGISDILYHLDRYSPAPANNSSSKTSFEFSRFTTVQWPLALRLALQGLISEPLRAGMRSVLLMISGNQENLPENLAKQDLLQQIQRLAFIHQVRIHVLSFESCKEGPICSQVVSYFKSLAKSTGGEYFYALEKNNSVVLRNTMKNRDVFDALRAVKNSGYVFSYTTPNNRNIFSRLRVQIQQFDMNATMDSVYIVP